MKALYISAVCALRRALGFIGVLGLLEMSVTVDWFAKQKLVPVDRAARGQLLADAVAGPRTVGVMLHHAVMSAQDRVDVGTLLELVAAHPAVSAQHLDRLAMSTAS